METYQEIASRLYSVAFKYLAESQGRINGSNGTKKVTEKSRPRLEILAATAGILASDVIVNKPQLSMYRR